MTGEKVSGAQSSIDLHIHYISFHPANALHLLDRNTHPLRNSAKPRRVRGPTHFYSYRDLVREQSLLLLLAIIQQFHPVSRRIVEQQQLY